MAAKRKQLAKWSRAATDGVGEVTFANGNKRAFRLEDIPEALVSVVLWYGLKQKLADTGSDAETVGEFEAAITAKWADIQDGEFNSGAGVASSFLEAIARLKGVSVEAVRKAVDAANDEQVKKWKANPAIKSAMADIAAERAKARLASETEEVDIEFEEV